MWCELRAADDAVRKHKSGLVSPWAGWGGAGEYLVEGDGCGPDDQDEAVDCGSDQQHRVWSYNIQPGLNKSESRDFK